MEDTSRKVRAVQQAFWMKLSEEERYRRCGEMYALAKQFAVSRAPKGLSPAEMKKFVFKELYGEEVPDTDQ